MPFAIRFRADEDWKLENLGNGKQSGSLFTFYTRERTFTRWFSFSIFRHSTLLRYTLWRITPMYLLFSYQYLRNKKHVPCFYRVIETRVKVWENEKCCGNTRSVSNCQRSRVEGTMSRVEGNMSRVESRE